MSCQFCNLNSEIKQRIIFENNLIVSFLSYQPIVPGHTIVIPKRHCSKFEDLNSEEKDSLFDSVKKLKSAMKDSLDITGFNIAWNEELIAGQTVPHFHLHIVPRKDGDTGIYEYELRKFLYRPGSRAISDNDELIEVAKVIRNKLV